MEYFAIFNKVKSVYERERESQYMRERERERERESIFGC